MRCDHNPQQTHGTKMFRSLKKSGRLRRISGPGHGDVSYARKLVTVISGGVFDLLDPVLERHSFDELGEVA